MSVRNFKQEREELLEHYLVCVWNETNGNIYESTFDDVVRDKTGWSTEQTHKIGDYAVYKEYTEYCMGRQVSLTMEGNLKVEEIFDKKENSEKEGMVLNKDNTLSNITIHNEGVFNMGTIEESPIQNNSPNSVQKTVYAEWLDEELKGKIESVITSVASLGIEDILPDPYGAPATVANTLLENQIDQVEPDKHKIRRSLSILKSWLKQCAAFSTRPNNIITVIGVISQILSSIPI